VGSHGHGGPPASPILTRAVELTEDGQWHNMEKLLRELAKMVPPGRAMRRAESNRLNVGGPPQRATGEVERILKTGRRSIVRDFVRPPWFELDPPVAVSGRVDPDRKVRLVQVPKRMIRDRGRSADGTYFNPVIIAKRLREAEQPRIILRTLKQSELLLVVLELLNAEDTSLMRFHPISLAQDMAEESGIAHEKE